MTTEEIVENYNVKLTAHQKTAAPASGLTPAPIRGNTVRPPSPTWTQYMGHTVVYPP